MRRIAALGLSLLFLLQAPASAASPGFNASSFDLSLSKAVQPLFAAIQGSYVVAVLTGEGERYEHMHAAAPARLMLQRNPIQHPATGEKITPVFRSGWPMTVRMRPINFDPRNAQADPLLSGHRTYAPPRASTMVGAPTTYTLAGPTRMKPIGIGQPSAQVAPAKTATIICGPQTFAAQRVPASVVHPYICITTPTPLPTPSPIPTPTPIPVTPTPAPTAAPVPALGAATTGIARWWTYEEKPLAGVGKAMVNVANGNLLVQADDVDVPERGIDLAFRRTYNSQSRHDNVGTDGSAPSVYGNGWTNTFDAHLAYNATSNVMSFYDLDGQRIDFSAVNGVWTPQAGEQGMTLKYDGNCSYWLTKKTGAVYYMWAPFKCGATPAGYNGRTYQIWGRNHNNYIQFNYSWANSDASTIQNVTKIVVSHSDGQALTLTFAKFNGINELYTITRPDNANITYNYDGAGNLLTVTRPGNAVDEATQTTPITSLVERYWWYGGTHEMSWIAGPRCMATFVANGGTCTDGGQYMLAYDANTTAGRLTWFSDYELVNFMPGDGTSTALQAGATGINWTTPWRQFQFVYPYTSPYTNAYTQLRDTQGHTTRWYPDASGRVTETDELTGDPASGKAWLVTQANWDASNNLSHIVDARGNITYYGYDANGNTIWVQEPQVTTNLGTGYPIARYAYDQFNNLVAYCDPQFVWTTGVTACSATSGAARYTYDYSDTAEPFGRLTDTYTPLGYHTAISYNTANSGGDTGLPTDVVGDTFTQNDGTTNTPQQHFTYNSLGNLVSYNKGYGNWQLTYDSLNRNVSVTDADNVVETRTCYNPDGSVSAKQSALQYSLDGVACGAHSVTFHYDADGNVVTENHHYGGTLGTTTKWYDGEDRLVEVSLPAGDATDFNGHGLTRYLYDLSNGSVASMAMTGVSGTYAAYGGLYKTQACYTGGNPACPAWTDLKGQAFDALDRLVTRYQHVPGQSTIAQYASTYDNDPTSYGLLSFSTDAMGVRATHTYDADGKETQISFGDNTPSRRFAFDPDGRPTQITSSLYGSVNYRYNADGHLLSKQEVAGSGMTSPALISYSYYPDGARASLSVSSQALSQNNLLQYAYRNDGRRTWLKYAPMSTPFAWTYTNAGRALAQSDPDTGQYAQNWGTLVPQQWSYDLNSSTNTGELTKLTLPEGNAYSSIAHDPEGNVTSTGIAPDPNYSGTSLGIAANIVNSYDARGQLTRVGDPANPLAYEMTTVTAGYACTNSTSPGCQVDLATGALAEIGATRVGGCPTTGSATWVNYDSDGREITKTVAQGLGNGACSKIAHTTTYDAENHTTGNSDGLALGWGAEGHASVAGTATLHWDGDDLLFASDSSGALTYFAIEKLAYIDNTEFTPPDGIQEMPNFGANTLVVVDRDYSGQRVQLHSATQASAWVFAPARHLSYIITGVYPNNATKVAPEAPWPAYPEGPFFAMDRTDGYSMAGISIQGVRAYDPSVGQWTTPDAYQGDVHDPSSQRSYMWNGNNPVAYSDPSGYEGYCAGCQGQSPGAYQAATAADYGRALDALITIVAVVATAGEAAVAVRESVAPEVGISSEQASTLQQASRTKGNFSMGSASESEANEMGSQWVGRGATTSRSGLGGHFKLYRAWPLENVPARAK